MPRELVATDSVICSSFDVDRACLCLCLGWKHDNVCLVVVEVILVYLDALPGMIKLLVLCERDVRRQRADQPASVEFEAVEQVDGALKLRHVDLVPFPVAPIEPREFIFTVAQDLHSEQVVTERALVVQEVLVVGGMLYLRVRVDWTVAHELVFDNFELAN